MENLQHSLDKIIVEFTPKFLNKRHSIKMEYTVEVFVRIFHKNMDYTVLKSGMYVSELRDIDFLRAYLS